MVRDPKRLRHSAFREGPELAQAAAAPLAMEPHSQSASGDARFVLACPLANASRYSCACSGGSSYSAATSRQSDLLPLRFPSAHLGKRQFCKLLLSFLFLRCLILSIAIGGKADITSGRSKRRR
jgi:hypothetical protein